MKLVLLSVLMLIAVVQTVPKHARLSSKNPATESRRQTDLKKYSRELSMGDPSLEEMRKNQEYVNRFRKLSFPKIRRGVIRPGKDKWKFRRRRRQRFFRCGKHRPEPTHNFNSPEQLQEYLFSEANAQHIPRRGAAFYGPKNKLERDAEHSRNSRGSNEPNEYHQFIEGDDSDWTAKSIRQIYTPFDEGRRNDEGRLKKRQKYQSTQRMKKLNGRRRRRPFFLHPYDLPYLYPPPWYVPRMKFMYPYEYASPPSIPKPSRELTLGDDLVKLRQMVDELDAMSEESRDGGTPLGKSDADKKNETMVDMKDKIDKVIIPILNKISQDLNATVASGVTAPTPQKPEASDGDAKRNKENENEREKDKEADNKKEVHLKHNFPCRIDGLWMCMTNTLHLNISTLPNMTLKVTVVSENPKKNNYITKDWAINGITLATTGGPFLLAAICPEKRKVANFIGQCRSCREEDIIFGFWTFSTAGKDCTEMFTSFETKIDVFKRDKSHSTKADKRAKLLAEKCGVSTVTSSTKV